MNELLGNRIKSLRIAMDFTQEQVADKIGVSRQKYARIENGVNNITLELLSKIASTLGVQIGDITKVLDEAPVVAYRQGEESVSAENVFEMIDLFYANKQMYTKLQNNNIA